MIGLGVFQRVFSAGFVLAATALPLVSAAENGLPDFDQDVRPILSDRCFPCHGPDAAKRQADLRLDVRASALGTTSSGLRAIEPRSPERSEVNRRITETDPDERMPPPTSPLRLSSKEIDTVRRWIEAGAEYTEHWAFVPPRRPRLPGAVASAMPTRNAIDRFVSAALDRQGLSPQPEARRETLIRRVTFDLTGLPPSCEEVDAFLADPSPDAYEKLVDRLLASRRFGERMAVDWLDLARYADSYGYQVDRDRFVWPWRDWVVRAFNEGLPYDEFVTWQLAGDLLPEATDEQVLATVFNRLHQQKSEGGSIPEEFRAEYVADRVRTFGTAFLGLSLECARCHDHKFDPISTREYYRLYAFFNQIDEAGLYAYFGSAIPTPTLLLADAAKKTEIRAAEVEAETAEERLRRVASRQHEAFETWLSAQQALEATIPGIVARHSFDELLEGNKLANAADPAKPATLHGENRLVEGREGAAVLLTGDDPVRLSVGNFPRHQPFSIALWLRTPDRKERAVIFHRSRAWTDSGSRGYQLLIEEGRLSASLIHFWPGNAIRVRTRKEVTPGQWVHAVMTWDGSSRADGLRLWINGRRAAVDVVRDKLTKNITGTGGDEITIGERFRDRGFKGGMVDDFCVIERELTPLEIAHLYDGRALDEALRAPPDALSAEKRADLYAYYLATRDDEYKEALAGLQAARRSHGALVDGLREIMVMRELDTPRATYVLARGHYASPGERVEAGTPAAFPPFPDREPHDRLGLARWLTGPDHPLFARVAVNRFWQSCFGRGLVGTSEDLGNQGERPMYPQLLDWLTVEFVEGGWDVKALLRLIVTSHAYRQRSAADPRLLRDDPANRLLARGPSHRLSAEMIRDNALAASGLLVEEAGGPPTKPYEVEVSFKPMKRGKGSELYRRSLYTVWKLTGPAPAMMAFDAVKRDVCVARRERTSTPLQALVLLNGPQYVEAARALAARVLRQANGKVSSALAEAFRSLTSRRPSREERAILARLFSAELTRFSESPERARAYLGVGALKAPASIPHERLAAMTAVTSMLLSYDETVTKR